MDFDNNQYNNHIIIIYNNQTIGALVLEVFINVDNNTCCCPISKVPNPFNYMSFSPLFSIPGVIYQMAPLLFIFT